MNNNFNRNRGKGNFSRRPQGGPDQPVRVKVPREGEVLCSVIALVGGSRLMVECKDGKDRMCRIPGKLRKKIWVNEGDIVIIKPWEIEGDKKGDIVWRYNKIDVSWLRKKGYL
ncbi:MAG: translation initiation factor eIF-1A [Candidatus ainarchaeum sp.]|nr:translation initiation factor eIF-1A [Candidatus ainarchaeum sp.]